MDYYAAFRQQRHDEGRIVLAAAMKNDAFTTASGSASGENVYLPPCSGKAVRQRGAKKAVAAYQKDTISCHHPALAVRGTLDAPRKAIIACDEASFPIFIPMAGSTIYKHLE